MAGRDETASAVRAGVLVLAAVASVAFTAGSAYGEAWRFVAVGDSRGYPEVNTPVLGELATAIVAESPELVVFPGDMVNGYPGTAAALQEWKATMAPVYDAGIAVYPVRGNHDVGTGWEETFGAELPTNGPPGQVLYTYSVTNRNALFLALDQYLPYHKVHQPWVDAQLASNTLPHVFAFGHEPAFKVRHTDCLGSYPAQRDTFWRSLQEGGARVYFCGHDHFYDHARLDDGDGNAADDLHQYVVGTAGAPLRSMRPYDGNNGKWTPVRHFYEATYGYCLVTIDGTLATIEWKRRVAPGVYAVGETFTYDVSGSEPARRHVSPDGNHEAPFASWETAATNIQDAVDAAIDFDVVLVSNGVYRTGERVAVGNVPNRIVLDGYVTVRGIGDVSNVVVVGNGPCGTGAVRCAYVGPHALLENVTLSNGHTRTVGDTMADLAGGAVWCAAGGTVSDCVIAGNEAYGMGGGGYAASGSGFANCVIADNAAQHGGGLFINGGGRVEHSTVTRNHASAVLYGGGGGVAAYGNNISFFNCIIHGNTGGRPNWFTDGTDVSFLYCCTVPSPSVSCITNLPGFVDGAGGDFRLATNSACVDRAAPLATSPVRDLLRVKRGLDGNNDGVAAPDIGAYEAIHPVADTDRDTLSDAAEILVHGTDATDPDTDMDGAADGHEVAAGTDPRDSASLLRITSCVTGPSNVVVTWDAVTDRVYAVYGAVGVNLGAWSNVGQRGGVDGSLSHTNPVTAGLRFFRIGVKEGQD